MDSDNARRGSLNLNVNTQLSFAEIILVWVSSDWTGKIEFQIAVLGFITLLEAFALFWWASLARNSFNSVNHIMYQRTWCSYCQCESFSKKILKIQRALPVRYLWSLVFGDGNKLVLVPAVGQRLFWKASLTATASRDEVGRTNRAREGLTGCGPQRREQQHEVG